MHRHQRQETDLKFQRPSRGLRAKCRPSARVRGMDVAGRPPKQALPIRKKILHGFCPVLTPPRCACIPRAHHLAGGDGHPRSGRVQARWGGGKGPRRHLSQPRLRSAFRMVDDHPRVPVAVARRRRLASARTPMAVRRPARCGTVVRDRRRPARCGTVVRDRRRPARRGVFRIGRRPGAFALGPPRRLPPPPDLRAARMGSAPRSPAR